MAACPSFLHGAVVDKIVVVVNSEVITQGEIDRVLMPVYFKAKTMYQGEDLMRKLDEARQSILGQLIDEKLMLGEAKKAGIEVDEKEVSARISEIQKRFGSKEMFERALAEQRMTVKDLKAKYRDQIMTKKLVDQKVGARIFITPVDVSEYYRKHSEEFAQPDEVKVRNILIRVKEGVSPEKALELAQEVHKKLIDGADFAELARTHSEGPAASDGGLMGYQKKGDLNPELEAVVFSLKEGETSDVIQTSLGCFIFKIEEKRSARSLNISEARRQIEDAIYSERAREKMKGWLEGLKKNAYIAFR
jgi:parvulin-like peptidyl-prolyl isomerase